MASESNSLLQSIIQRKMVRKPQFTPKTTKGQQTLGQNPENVKQYQGLKSEYYLDPPKIRPFLEIVKSRMKTYEMKINEMKTNEEIQEKTTPPGIYTWILKRGKLHIAPLITNQEIGSLHTNMNTLTITTNNLGLINQATLKNKVNEKTKAVLRVTPQVAGELLLTRAVDGVEIADGPLRIYFNIQSGTFSEKIITARAKALASERGVSPKDPQVKEEVRDGMVDETRTAMAGLVGVPLENIRFLGCDENIQHELEGIPLLNQGAYDFGPCRDDDGYLESEAGRNLIRRFTIHTSAENRSELNKYFTNERQQWTPPPQAVTAYANSSAPDQKTGKVKKTRDPQAKPYNRTSKTGGRDRRFYKKNNTRKMKRN